MSRRAASVLIQALAVLVAAGPATAGGGRREPRKGSDPSQQYNLGKEFLRQGRPDRAVPFLEKAVQEDPENALFGYALGLAYMGVRDNKRAGDTFVKVLDIDPFFTDAHNSLGIVYGEEGEWMKSRAEFERVLADKRYLTPEVARFNIGRLLLQQGAAVEALPYLRAATESKPERSEWRLHYGLALEQAGRLEEARKELEAALQGSGDDIEALYHLGVVSDGLKDPDRARKCLERILTLSPNSDAGRRAADYLKQIGS